MRRPADALPLLRAIARDPSADAETARLAEHRLVAALLDAGAASDAAREADAHPGGIDRVLAARVRRMIRRRAARWAAWSALAVQAGGTGFALVRAALSGASRGIAFPVAGRAALSLSPLALALGAYCAAVGAGLASLYEGGRGAPFAWLGAAVVPLALVSRAWSALGSNRAVARLGRAVVCAAAVLAAAFLVLAGVDPAYLEGFGL